MLLLFGVIAAANPPPIQLIESIPTEVSANSTQIADAAPTWVSMFDAAQTSIDIASFYISPSDKKDALDPVWESLRRSVDRGVQLRVLVDLSFSDKYPEPLKELETWPNTQIKRTDYSPGVMHAKYFVVDKKEAFVGSQNFDYRALEHIFELGIRIQEKHLVQSISRVFDLGLGNIDLLSKAQDEQRYFSGRLSPSISSTRGASRLTPYSILDSICKENPSSPVSKLQQPNALQRIVDRFG